MRLGNGEIWGAKKFYKTAIALKEVAGPEIIITYGAEAV